MYCKSVELVLCWLYFDGLSLLCTEENLADDTNQRTNSARNKVSYFLIQFCVKMSFWQSDCIESLKVSRLIFFFFFKSVLV